MAKRDHGVVKRAIVTPDKHVPLHDIAAINVVKKAIEIVKPDMYIDLGDLGEWGSVSHWQWARKKKPPLEYITPKVEQDIKDEQKTTGLTDGQKFAKFVLFGMAMHSGIVAFFP